MTKTGEVKFFNRTKNFGFVKESDGDTEYFFHGSTVEGPLPRDGDSVEFVTEESDKGPRATGVKVVGGSLERDDAAVQLDM
jgi:Cold shock proteins